MQTDQSKTKGLAAVASSDLLACPFCGGQWIPEHPKMLGMMPYTSTPKLEELTEGGWRVTCYGCGVGTWDNLKYTREQAIEAWNTRKQANDTSAATPEGGLPKEKGSK